MQDDYDELGIVLEPDEPEAKPAREKKPKAGKPKQDGTAPGMPKQEAKAMPAPGPTQEAKAMPAPGPTQEAQSKPEPVPGPKQYIPKPSIFSGPAAAKHAAKAPSHAEAKPVSSGGIKKGIFRDLNVQRKPSAEPAPGACPASKGIFCRLNAPSSAVRAASSRERVPSGVPGLDEMIEGGFERDSSILITGGPGCGKTTLLFQFLVNGATMYEEPGLFISFEEEKEELFVHYRRFGWDLEGLEKDKTVMFVKYAPHEVAKFIDSGGGMLKDMITDAGIRRIAIDSLTSFSMLFKDEYDKRFNIIKFFDILRTWKCTVMLTAERPIELSAAYDDFGLEFLVDAVLLIYNVRRGNVRERALEVLKMRGTNQLTKLCPLKITGDGVVVFPSESIFTDISEKA